MDAAEEVVNFEIHIAKASWHKREMSMHTEQYNSHSLASLEKIYPNIGWRNYFKTLLGLKNLDEGALGTNYVPRNFEKIVLRSLKHHMDRSLDLKESSIHCMEMVVNYLPFGAGYVYVKSMEDRDKRYDEIRNYARLMIKTFQ
ncbi:hypothetical protein ANCDUO_20892, partial [Ancylostoma duodenale]